MMDIIFLINWGVSFFSLSWRPFGVWLKSRGEACFSLLHLSDVTLACFGRNERYIFANFFKLALIGHNKVHWGHSFWCDRAIRTMFYECLAVLTCGLHFGDLLIWSRAQTSWAICWVLGSWESEIDCSQCSNDTSICLRLLF